MELLDQALIRLYRNGVINKDKVFEFCNDRDEITRLTGERDESGKDDRELVTAGEYN
jgi:hypothetical protein